jgi:diguanylate cyclase (GGDEF)-like protein
METVSPVFYDGKRAVLGNLMDLTERKTADEQLLYLSTHDSLTSLYNRAYFEAEVKRLEHGRKFPVNVLLADIDFLKETNDTLGHWAGDDLLRRTASVLRQVFRREDVVARIGGDEFSAIWTDSGQMSAETVLPRIKRSLTSHNKAYPDMPLSLSIGIASGPKGCSISKLMREADKKMYEEKAVTRETQNVHHIRRVK